MKRVPESLVPGRHSLDRRAFVQLATTFGLSLTVPGLAAKSPALTTDEWTLIGEVSELIIPTTDTGGALAAGVPDFVKMMLSEWFSAAERENFIAGMQEFSAGNKNGKKFAEMTARQKDQYFGELLATAEGAATAPRTPFRGPQEAAHDFRLLHERTRGHDRAASTHCSGAVRTRCGRQTRRSGGFRDPIRHVLVQRELTR